MTNGTPWSASGSVGFYLEFFRFVGYYGRPRPARYLVGGNSGFRIDLLRQLRYSDHSLGEDMLVSSRLSRQGNRLLFLPRASVRHLNRTGVNTVLRLSTQTRRGGFLLPFGGFASLAEVVSGGSRTDFPRSFRRYNADWRESAVTALRAGFSAIRDVAAVLSDGQYGVGRWGFGRRCGSLAGIEA